MTLNGREITFDIDNRETSKKYIKQLTIIAKKQQTGKMNDDDMEGFLRGCLLKSEVDDLLADGKLSTLAKVFVDFFDQALDQRTATMSIYAEMADKIHGMQEKISVALTETEEQSNKIAELNSFIAQRAEANAT